MSKSIYPENYHSDLNLHDTQVAIKTVKDFFQQRPAPSGCTCCACPRPFSLSLPESGLNDNLNGVERPVSLRYPRAERANMPRSSILWQNGNATL